MRLAYLSFLYNQQSYNLFDLINYLDINLRRIQNTKITVMKQLRKIAK